MTMTLLVLAITAYCCPVVFARLGFFAPVRTILARKTNPFAPDGWTRRPYPGRSRSRKTSSLSPADSRSTIRFERLRYCRPASLRPPETGVLRADRAVQADLDALAAALSRLSRLAPANADTIESLDIRPFVVRPEGALALYAVLVTSSPPHDPPRTPLRPSAPNPAESPVFGLQSGIENPGRGRQCSPRASSTAGPDNRAQALEPRCLRIAYRSIRRCAPAAREEPLKRE